MKHSVLLLGLLLASAARAEVVLDGSLGPGGALSGPDFRVGAELGQRAGANLFHSFSAFNLSQTESATFSGPESIDCVIGRVTGGGPSTLDGTLRSTLPQADVYLINPAGLVFGPHAKLDVPGAFYAGVADSLEFGDGSSFSARPGAPSSLSVAVPTAFGFLSEAALTVQDTGLRVGGGQTLGLVGGVLRVENSLVSAPAGKILIQGGQVVLDNSVLNTDSGGDGQGGGIAVHADDLELAGGAWLSSFTKGTGTGGDITLNVTGDIRLRGVNSGGMPALVRADTVDGTGGRILVHAANLRLEDGARFSATTWGIGAGGNIEVTTDSGVALVGESAKGTVSGIFALSASQDEDAGDAGKISVHTGNLSLQNGARINGDTWGGGQGGQLSLNATEKIALSSEQADGSSSIVSASARSPYPEVRGGDIELNAPQIELRDGAQIGASTFGAAQGGAVRVQADTLSLSGRNRNNNPTAILTSVARDPYAPERETTGHGGTLRVTAESVTLGQGAQISVHTASRGAGGDLEIQAGSLGLRDNALITAGSEGRGDAGRVRIRLDGPLFMDHSAIRTATQGADGGNLSLSSPTYLDLRDSEISTSVYDSTEISAGNGGDIQLEPAFIALERSRIFARAVRGNGGNIDITTHGIFPAYNIADTINASSEFGLDGVITIDAPDVDVLGAFVLPAAFLDASALQHSACDVETARAGSRFIYTYESHISFPEDLRGSGALSSQHPGEL